jgi:hypothetical protein
VLRSSRRPAAAPDRCSNVLAAVRPCARPARHPLACWRGARAVTLSRPRVSRASGGGRRLEPAQGFHPHTHSARTVPPASGRRISRPVAECRARRRSSSCARLGSLSLASDAGNPAWRLLGTRAASPPGGAPKRSPLCLRGTPVRRLRACSPLSHLLGLERTAVSRAASPRHSMARTCPVCEWVTQQVLTAPERTDPRRFQRAPTPGARLSHDLGGHT